MNEEMLRAMIREAVARRLGQEPEPAVPAPAAVLVRHGSEPRPLPASALRRAVPHRAGACPAITAATASRTALESLIPNPSNP